MNIEKKTEIIAGVTTFLTMSYIILLNPAILSTEGTGMNFSGVMSATILVSFVSTLLMGLYAKLPFALAPGMGINAFFTYGLILGAQIPYPKALGLVFWSGIFFVIISITPIKKYILESIPIHLRLALTAGIGTFLLFIGLKNGQIITQNSTTIVGQADFSLPMLCTVLGIILIYFFQKLKITGHLILSILMITLLAIVLGLTETPKSVFATPDFKSVFFKLDIWGGLKWAYLPSILALILTDLFDSLSTFIGVSQASNQIDQEGKPLNMNKALFVDSLATLLSAPFGTSAATTYIESSAGVEAGGRTGLTSIVTAFCFIPFLFLSPLLKIVPIFATAPILIYVGLQMLKAGLQNIKDYRQEEIIPFLFIVIMTPFTFSITSGILWGFLIHVILFIIYKRVKELHIVNYIMAILAILHIGKII